MTSSFQLVGGHFTDGNKVLAEREGFELRGPKVSI